MQPYYYISVNKNRIVQIIEQIYSSASSNYWDL